MHIGRGGTRKVYSRIKHTSVLSRSVNANPGFLTRVRNARG